MKHITYLIFLLPFLVFSQIHGSLLEAGTVSKSSLDISTQNQIDSGSTSPQEFIVSTESDLSDVSNENKIALLQSNITLTGNLTLASGLIIKGQGGVISGAFNLTLDESNAIISDSKENTIINDDVTISGNTNPAYPVWLEWFGAVRHTETANYDNHNAIYNALKAGKHGYIYLNEGHYYTQVFENSRFSTPRPNLTIEGAGTHAIGMGKTKTKIQAIQNDALNRSVVFVVRDAPNGSFEHIWVQGDMLTTGDTQNEFRTGITVENNSHDFQILHNRLSHFSGDGTNAYAWDDYHENTFTFTAGGINESTGVDESDSYVWRSDIINISNQAKNQGYGMVTGQGYGGYSTLSDFNCKIYWYDSSSTFIGTTDWVFTYKDVPLPDGADKLRVVIYNPIGDVAPTGLLFRGLYHSKRVILAYNEIDHNFRNGWSNYPQEAKIIYNHIHDNGGRLGGPSYGGDQEDGYQVLSDVEIAYNVFENNHSGAITLRWINTTYIHHNTFKGNATLIGGKSDVNARESWNVQIHNNSFYNVDVSLGRFAELVDNYMESSKITMANAYTRCENNVLYNPLFNRAGDSPTAYGESIIKNNTIIVTRPFELNMFSGGLNIIDNTIDFRNDTTISTIGLFHNYATTDLDGYKDYIDGLKVVTSQSQSSYQGISIYPMDMRNSSFDEFLYVQGGVRQNIKWIDNNYVKRIEFILANTPFTTDGSDFKTLEIIRGKIIASNTDVTGDGVLKFPAIDLNIKIKGLEFDLTDATVLDDVFDLSHNGSLRLEDCVFKTDAASTWNMNNTTMPTATFKNCQFVNITPTFRAGDNESGSEIYTE